MSKEDLKKYSKKYPRYLSNKKVITILKEGSLLKDDVNIYKVVSCYRSPVPNKPPEIRIEKIGERANEA